MLLRRFCSWRARAALAALPLASQPGVWDCGCVTACQSASTCCSNLRAGCKRSAGHQRSMSIALLCMYLSVELTLLLLSSCMKVGFSCMVMLGSGRMPCEAALPVFALTSQLGACDCTCITHGIGIQSHQLQCQRGEQCRGRDSSSQQILDSVQLTLLAAGSSAGNCECLLPTASCWLRERAALLDLKACLTRCHCVLRGAPSS